MNTLDIALWVFGIGLAFAFVYIIWSYAKGLQDCPRELWILFLTKVIEYSAYGAMNMTFALYLSSDCGLSDEKAGVFIGIWSSSMTVVTILVGAVVDAIGIKKTLLIGTIVLLVSRVVMPFTSNIYIVTVFGFVPAAVGIAIMGPVLSVGIKYFTTKESMALGFGLFYTLMNVGWAIGAFIFDKVRGVFGEHAAVSVPYLNIEMSTYQIIFLVGFVLSIPNLLLIMVMRKGVRMTEDQGVVFKPEEIKQEGGFFEVFGNTAQKAAGDTFKILKSSVFEKAFWYFLFMLGILVFVRLVFYHFHYTFPKYGIRVLGESVKIGNIYGVLNPIMIVFLVPFISSLTKKVSSYKMMLFGTILSAFSVFIATIPAEVFSPLVDTWVGELVYVRWLEVPEGQRLPVFLALIIFIMIFTIGEAFWSPRLMQFTAQIAPEGKEGSYIALSYLPYFASKPLVGFMSGWLVGTYTPEGAASYPNHYMVWIWIGSMAALTPLGLVIFHRLYRNAEEKDIREATS